MCDVKRTAGSVLVFLLVFAAGCQRSAATGSGQGTEPLPFAGGSIDAMVGSASKPATEKAARLFEQRVGARVVLHFGGSCSRCRGSFWPNSSWPWRWKSAC